MSEGSGESGGVGLGRWLVVGVLAVALVGLLLMGDEPAGPGGEPAAGGGVPAPEAGVPAVAPQEDVPVTLDPERTEADAECAVVADRVKLLYGDEFAQRVGDKLFYGDVMPIQEVGPFCRSLEPLGDEAITARIFEATGERP